MQQSTWFTPEGLEDLLPPQAQKLEAYRRQLIDGFQLSGYDLVLPPLAEFTDSLLTGTARHLAIETCRFTDQESGRMMGVRADITPQIARIVANRLKANDRISRLCYVGEVLKTRNNKAKGSRSPIQVGAEIFGHSGLQSDLEIIELMLESLTRLPLTTKLSLGHVGVVDELMQLAGLSNELQTQLIDVLERKAIPEFEAFVAQLPASEWTLRFTQLMNLCGDAEMVMEQAQTHLTGLSARLDSYLAHMQGVVSHLVQARPGLSIHLDFADIRGYEYHTGVIFAAYSACGCLQPIANGGRYDNISADFGLALPATGFSLDLRTALDLLPVINQVAQETVYSPCAADPALQLKVAELKQQGIQVIKAYEPQTIPAGARRLEKQGASWNLV
ncbi:MAG: ATP phosphoribosyltransferase regulatory subunit [Thiotrichales bacterium]|nr:ATP phosphoribosyltransferase regulatory subunit [Thiotrichales bacterium]